MHVLHILATLGLGGAEQLVLDLAARQQDRGYTVSIAVTNSADPGQPDYAVWQKRISELARAGVDVIELGTGTWDALRVGTRLRRRVQPVDIVHSHVLVGTVGAAVGLRGNPPIVWTLHSTGPGFPKQAVALTRPIVAEYVACSSGVADAFTSLVGSKLRTIQNGVDTRRFATVPRPLDDDGVFDLLAIGGLKGCKNYPRLVRAVAAARPRVEASNQRLRLTILGDGDQRATIEAEIQNTGTADCIHLKGAHADIGPFLGSADAFVMSSDYEGLPIALLEAMGSGLPAVTSPFASALDLLRDGIDAILARSMEDSALCDALVELAVDRQLQAQLSAGAVRLARDFDISQCALQYEELYEEVLSRRRSRR